MLPGRQYSPKQGRFRLQVIALDLACNQVLEELIHVNEKGVLPEDSSRLNLFKDSFNFYTAHSRYNGPTDKRDLLFQTDGEEYVLKKAFKEEYKIKARELYSQLKSLLAYNNSSSKLRKTSKALISDISLLMQTGMYSVDAPPEDIPVGVRLFARKFALK